MNGRAWIRRPDGDWHELGEVAEPECVVVAKPVPMPDLRRPTKIGRPMTVTHVSPEWEAQVLEFIADRQRREPTLYDLTIALDGAKQPDPLWNRPPGAGWRWVRDVIAWGFRDALGIPQPDDEPDEVWHLEGVKFWSVGA